MSDAKKEKSRGIRERKVQSPQIMGDAPQKSYLNLQQEERCQLIQLPEKGFGCIQKESKGFCCYAPLGRPLFMPQGQN